MSDYDCDVTSEKVLEYKRKYYRAHREKILERKKERREQDGDRLRDQEKKKSIGNTFPQKWDEVIKLLKSSGHDLSKIGIVREREGTVNGGKGNRGLQ